MAEDELLSGLRAMQARELQDELRSMEPTCRVRVGLAGRTTVSFRIFAHGGSKALVLGRALWVRANMNELRRLARNALADLHHEQRTMRKGA